MPTTNIHLSAPKQLLYLLRSANIALCSTKASESNPNQRQYIFLKKWRNNAFSFCNENENNEFVCNVQVQ